MAAAGKGNIAAVKRRIAQGDDVNGSFGGMSVLMVAIDKNNLKIVKLLVSAGADLEFLGAEAITPLTMACHKGYYENRGLPYRGWCEHSD